MSFNKSKRQTEKNQQILKTLLHEPCNKVCADCKTSKNPRWASWNLGVFICIRCSGIHRSMGTHISRVKSVDLDSWTDEQTKSMVLWGNAKANAYWEAKLPDGYVPNESKIENFIRTKYDLKKWSASPTVPDPRTIDILSLSSSSATVTNGSTPTPIQSQSQPQAQKVPIPSSTQNESSSSSSLLDFTSKTKSQSQQQTIKTNTTSSNPTISLLENAVPQNNSRPDLKKSILSLYSTPTPSSGSLPMLNSGSSYSSLSQQQQQQQQTQQHSGLSSLYAQGPSQSTHSFGQQTQTQPKTQAQQYDNVWSKNASSCSSSSDKKVYGDDPFKNVWN